MTTYLTRKSDRHPMAVHLDDVLGPHHEVFTTLQGPVDQASDVFLADGTFGDEPSAVEGQVEEMKMFFEATHLKCSRLRFGPAGPSGAGPTQRR